MGDVITTFVPRRIGRRYAEILKSDGKEAADLWYGVGGYQHTLSDKDKQIAQTEALKYINKPKGTA